MEIKLNKEQILKMFIDTDCTKCEFKQECDDVSKYFNNEALGICSIMNNDFK